MSFGDIVHYRSARSVYLIFQYPILGKASFSGFQLDILTQISSLEPNT